MHATEDQPQAPDLKTTAGKCVELFVLSFAALYLELLVIRWMSADIRAFSIFKTFPLVTFFVGLGLGLSRGSDRWFRWCPVAVLLMVALIELPDFLKLRILMFPFDVNADWRTMSTGFLWVYLPLFMALFTIILAGPFAVAACIGTRLGVVFNQLRPLVAYCVNIGGSIAGSLLFAVVCFMGLPPWMLLVLPAILLVAYSAGRWQGRLPAVLVLAAAVALAGVGRFNAPGVTTYWSPYQRLDLVPLTDTQKAGRDGPAVHGYVLETNKLPYQAAVDLTADRYKHGTLDERVDNWQRHWMLPFQLKPPGDVLIVGAGMGSDVVQALNYGVGSVDAVDIDPVIIALGKKFHPLQPYASERVHVICDDARHFFNQCRKKYDLIVFSQLDSHTVSGLSSSVRLDNYVYTRESIRKALELLKPDGILVLQFTFQHGWFQDRLYWTIRNAIGYEPLAFRDRWSTRVPNTFFIAGTPVQAGEMVLPAAVAEYADRFTPTREVKRILTDDWPYLYLAPQSFDLFYMLIVGEIILLALAAGRGLLLRPAPPQHWQMFFLGAAFMLLELQFISRLSLLYGSTWVTSAIVINGALVVILLANLAVMRWQPALERSGGLLYALLMASLAISYAMPAEFAFSWQGLPDGLSYGIVTAVTFLPILFAAMVFSTSFARLANPSRALAFNLFGAVAGALLEYLSNYVGINSLLLVAGVLYAGSFVFWRRAGRGSAT